MVLFNVAGNLKHSQHTKSVPFLWNISNVNFGFIWLGFTCILFNYNAKIDACSFLSEFVRKVLFDQAIEWLWNGSMIPNMRVSLKPVDTSLKITTHSFCRQSTIFLAERQHLGEIEFLWSHNWQINENHDQMGRLAMFKRSKYILF